MLSVGRTQHPMLCAPVHSDRTLVRVTTAQQAGTTRPAPATMPATVHGDHCRSASTVVPFGPAESTEDRPLVVLDGTWSQQASQLSRRPPLCHRSTTSPHALIDVCGRFNMVGDTSRYAPDGCCSFEIDVPDDLCAMGSVCIGRRRT